MDKDHSFLWSGVMSKADGISSLFEPLEMLISGGLGVNLQANIHLEGKRGTRE